jgi:hypothetical protein
MKVLCSERNGFILYYKRLYGHGAKFQWLKDPECARNIEIENTKEKFTLIVLLRKYWMVIKVPNMNLKLKLVIVVILNPL